MCGIVGVMADKLFLGDYLRFKDLFTLAQLRGDEGAGIATVPKKNHVEKVRVKKTTWSSGHLVCTSEYDEAIKGDNSILIGHARQPTKGGTKAENVHPHIHDGIVLVHNGTMSHVGGEAVPNGESDSKQVCKTIATKGLEYFVQNSYGAYCLVWVDLHKQTLNFIRNSERPLYLVEQRFSKFSDNTTHLWWASELWMIHQALIRYPSFDKDALRSYPLPTNEHWEFPLSVGTYITAPKKTKVEKVYVHTHTNPQSRYYGSGVWDAWDYDDVDQDPLLGNNKGGTGTGTSVVPFRAANGTSTSAGSLASGKSGTDSTTKYSNGGFTYIPPEYRSAAIEPDYVSSDGAGTTTAVVSPLKIFDTSKKNADLNAAVADKIVEKQKEVASSNGGFRSPVCLSSHDEQLNNLSKYAESRKEKVFAFITAGECVWCGIKPSIIAGQTTTIYPVRWGQERKDYVCSPCAENDQDVQRMVGII